MSKNYLVSSAQHMSRSQTSRVTREVERAIVGPSHPPLPRQQDRPEAVKRLAKRLWADGRIAETAQRMANEGQKVQHFYAPRILKPRGSASITQMLMSCFANGQAGYIQGEMHGVGTSQLMVDWMRACNSVTDREGIPRQVLVHRLMGTCSNPKLFLDGLADATGLDFTASQLRGAIEKLARRVLAALYHKNVGMLVIDHVRHAQGDVLDFISEMIHLLDPVNRAELVGEEGGRVGAIGVMLADRAAPEVVFRRHAATLMALQGRHTVLRRYSRPEEVAEAIRQAGVGLDDLNLDARDDREMVSILSEHTLGLPANMNPFLQRVLELVRFNGGHRPTPAVFAAVLPYYRVLVQLDEQKNPITDEKTAVVVPIGYARRDKRERSQSGPKLTSAERVEAREHAREEQKRMNRSSVVAV